MITILPPLSAGLVTMSLLPFRSSRTERWLEEIYIYVCLYISDDNEAKQYETIHVT